MLPRKTSTRSVRGGCCIAEPSLALTRPNAFTTRIVSLQLHSAGRALASACRASVIEGRERVDTSAAIMINTLQTRARRRESLDSAITKSPELPRRDEGLLLYVRQNSIQLVETVVMDDELALAFGAMFKLYARAQFFGQLFLQTADVGIRGLHRRRSAGVCEQAPHQALGFPYR